MPPARPATRFTLSWPTVTGQKNHPAHRLALAHSRGDSVTTRQQTPWGGTFLRGFLPGLHQLPADLCAGEVWELSLAAERPSFLRDGSALAEWARSVRTKPEPSLLLKWLDSDDWLSLQVHPAEPENGVGKVECWYVVRAEHNATLYAGVKPELGRDDFEAAMQRGLVTDCLQAFHPQAGDVFLIDTGTPHALGPGISVLELQRTAPGDAGTTLRFWDWNRRYDGDGRPSGSGAARPLHLPAALAATRWQSRASLHARLPRAQATEGHAVLEVLIGAAGAPRHGASAVPEPGSIRLCDEAGGASGCLPRLSHAELTLARAYGSGPVRWTPSWPWSSLTVMRGRLTVETSEGEKTLERGQSALLHAEQEIVLNLDEAEVVLGSTAPVDTPGPVDTPS